VVIDEFISRSGLDIHPTHEIDNLTMAVSMVASIRGVTLFPAYAENFLPGSVISRPLAGDPPTIDLVIGHSKTNTSQTLQLFLSRVDDLIARRWQRPAEPQRARWEEKSRTCGRKRSDLSVKKKLPPAYGFGCASLGRDEP
jgi:hypothetical protein